MPQTGPINRSPKQQAHYEAEIARLDRQGYTQFYIAEKMGVSQGQLSKDLKRIREAAIAEFKEASTLTLEEQLLKYADLLQEARLAFNRSTNDYVETITESVPERTCAECGGKKYVETLGKTKRCPECRGKGKTGGVIRKTEKRRAQVGDVRFLQLMKACYDQICLLLNLVPKEPKGKDREPANVVQINWANLYGRQSVDDEVEAELLRIEDEARNLALLENSPNHTHKPKKPEAVDAEYEVKQPKPSNGEAHK